VQPQRSEQAAEVQRGERERGQVRGVERADGQLDGGRREHGEEEQQCCDAAAGAHAEPEQQDGRRAEQREVRGEHDVDTRRQQHERAAAGVHGGGQPRVADPAIGSHHLPM
jgi:hypothetical protein